RYLAFRDREELIDRALRILEEKGSNLDFIQQRIRIVRESDISGYRGGAPMDGATEAFDQVAAPKAVPREAILIAADGSQIYPSLPASVSHKRSGTSSKTYISRSGLSGTIISLF
ncbi:MAG: hypothetical protein AAGK74_04670, partial [Chloroflexota bacterium]